MIFLLSSRRNLGSHLIWLTGWIGLVALLLPFLSGGDVTQSTPPVYAMQAGTVYALDPQTGRVRWSFAGGDYRFSYLHATATSVYFAVPNDSVSSFDLVALQASRGEPQWHTHLAVKYIKYLGANAIDLVFGVLAPGDPNTPSDDHMRRYVLAISQANGHVHWAHYMHSDYGFGPTSVRNDLIVVTKSGIWAWAAQVFDAQSGMERWSTEYTNSFLILC